MMAVCNILIICVFKMTCIQYTTEPYSVYD